MRKIAKLFALLAVPALIWCAAKVTEKQLRITGTYSDMESHEKSGDVIGVEIRVVWGQKSNFHGTFQIAEGAPSDLVQFVLVEDKGKIKFELPAASKYSGNFVGRILNDKLVGTFTYSNGVDMELSLPRKRSYWDAD